MASQDEVISTCVCSSTGSITLLFSKTKFIVSFFVCHSSLPIPFDFNTKQIQNHLSRNMIKCSFCSSDHFEANHKTDVASVKMSLIP